VPWDSRSRRASAGQAFLTEHDGFAGAVCFRAAVVCGVPARCRLQGLELAPNHAARAGGFSLHAGGDIAPQQRKKLELLCR